MFIIDLQNVREGSAGEKGSGIGLNLVKELVKLNKGTIKVTSEVGVGTSFDIFFPDCIQKNE